MTEGKKKYKNTKNPTKTKQANQPTSGKLNR